MNRFAPPSDALFDKDVSASVEVSVSKSGPRRWRIHGWRSLLLNFGKVHQQDFDDAEANLKSILAGKNLNMPPPSAN